MAADKPQAQQALSRDWLAKSLAGTLLGLAIALALSALFTHFNADMPLAVRAQLAMWMVVPLWLGILSGVFLFSSGRRAWLWLGGASLGLYGLLALL
jgi:hypothetical protein